MGLFDLVEQAVPTNNWVAPNEFPDLSSVDTIACDTETRSLDFRKSKPVGISIAYREDYKLKKYYFPFGHSEGNLDEEKVKRWFCDEMAFHRVVFCNGKFDAHQLWNWGVDLEALGIEICDVQFEAALLDDSPFVKVDLETLSQQYLGVGKVKLRGSKSGMADKPAWAVGEYAEGDAGNTLELDEIMMPMIRSQSLERVLDLENNIIPVVCEIERNGSRVHRETLDKWLILAPKLFSQTITEIHRLTGIGLNPNATESMEALFKHLNLPIPKKHKNDNPKEKLVSSFTAENLMAVGHPVIDLALRAKRVDSVRSRYLEPFLTNLDANNHLYYALHQLKGEDEEGKDKGTISGRFSSSGGGKNENSGYSFNVQQVSKKDDEIGEEFPMREIFICDPKMKYFACDAKQIEYRLFAHFSRAKSVLGAYDKDRDINYHKFIWGMLKAAGSSIDYQQCKNANFARLYGAGPPKMSKMIKVALAQTKEFLKDYDRVLPEAGPYLRSMSDLAGSQGYITTLLGRRARFPGGQRLHKAVNSLIQGSAADIMKMVMLDVYKNRKTLGISKLRQVVHDEQDADVDHDPAFMPKIKDFFDQQRVDLLVPILWDCGFGSNWKEAKKEENLFKEAA